MAKQEKSAAEAYRNERKARLAKAAKKNAKKSISSDSSTKIAKVISILLVVALVGGICGVAVNLSGVVQKNRTAFTVGEEKISQPEYSYYYTSVYNMVSSYAQYGYDIGFDPSVAPDKQEYSGMFGDIEDFPKDETPMWTDYFEYNAKQRIQYVKACVLEAEKLGLKLDETAEAAVQKSISDLETTAKNNGFSLSAYLRETAGKGVSKAAFEKVLTEQQIASLVEKTKTEELKKSYSAKEIEKEFKDHIDDYGVVSLRSYMIKAEKVKGDGEDAEEAVTKATMQAAKKKAEAFAAGLYTQEAFKQRAGEYEKNAGNKEYKKMITDDSLTLIKDSKYADVSNSASEKVLKWAFGNAKIGEVMVDEVEDTGYAVYMMADPIHKAADKYSYDARHILFKFPEAEEDADKAEDEKESKKDDKKDEKTEEVKTLDLSAYKDVTVDLDVNAETAKDKATYKKAQDVLQKYLDGDRTAEAFGALAKEYTEDSNGEAGGLYENVPQGDFVAEFENWCLEKGRKPGDVGIVETSYGYHIIYFVKSQAKSWSDEIREDLAGEQLADYTEKLANGDNVKITDVNDKAIADVDAFLVKFVRQHMRASAQQ